MISVICTEKYPVIRLTGINSIVTFASSMVMRVRRSTAVDCLSVIKLKFCQFCEQDLEAAEDRIYHEH